MNKILLPIILAVSIGSAAADEINYELFNVQGTFGGVEEVYACNDDYGTGLYFATPNRVIFNTNGPCATTNEEFNLYVPSHNIQYNYELIVIERPSYLNAEGGYLHNETHSQRNNRLESEIDAYRNNEENQPSLNRLKTIERQATKERNRHLAARARLTRLYKEFNDPATTTERKQIIRENACKDSDNYVSIKYAGFPAIYRITLCENER